MTDHDICNGRPVGEAEAFVMSDSDGQQLVVGVGATVDQVQRGREWIATHDPVEVEP